MASYGEAAEIFIAKHGLSDNSAIVDRVSDGLRGFGYAGDFVVLKSPKEFKYGGGWLPDGTLVLFDDAIENGLRLGGRFLSGDAILAHEIGHSLVKTHGLGALDDIHYATSSWRHREYLASKLGAELPGLCSSARQLLLDDAAALLSKWGPWKE